MGRTDYRIKQDWMEFEVPGATGIAQSSFWWGNCVEDKSFAMWINENTIPRFKKIPKLRKAADLNQFVQTQLISNATGEFRYHRNSRQRLRFDQANDNTDWDFVRALYVLFWRHVLPCCARLWRQTRKQPNALSQAVTIDDREAFRAEDELAEGRQTGGAAPITGCRLIGGRCDSPSASADLGPARGVPSSRLQLQPAGITGSSGLWGPGTWPAATTAEAPRICLSWSSKKICAPSATRTGALARIPTKCASSAGVPKLLECVRP
jgi:hypothetical protein